MYSSNNFHRVIIMNSEDVIQLSYKQRWNLKIIGWKRKLSNFMWGKYLVPSHFVPADNSHWKITFLRLSFSFLFLSFFDCILLTGLRLTVSLFSFSYKEKMFISLHDATKRYMTTRHNHSVEPVPSTFYNHNNTNLHMLANVTNNGILPSFTFPVFSEQKRSWILNLNLIWYFL